MKTFKELSLPCLRGAVGEWIYYSTVIPYSELQRIDTHHKIKEDKNLDTWLQREVSDRVEVIKEYLLQENERFFNSIIVGLYGEIPEWYILDLKPIEEKFNVTFSSTLTQTLGILSLTGKEILFTIDGQHRIEAIKKAIADNKQRFISDELPVIFVGHSLDGKGLVRTRKLFATINREAKAPSSNDLAIIDETYAYNIVARMIYAKYALLKDKIALTDTYNLDRNDHKNFTNLLNLVEVNKKLFKATDYIDSKYTSPSFEKREELYTIATEFYDYIFSNVDEYREYFEGTKKLSEFRNASHNKPLNLLFLPIGLILITELYVHFKAIKGLNKLSSLINKLDFDLYNGDFKYIYFNPVQNTVVTSYRSFGKNFALYLLRENTKLTKDALKKGLAKAYNINEFTPAFRKLKIPPQLKLSAKIKSR